jgi:esterase/lipase
MVALTAVFITVALSVSALYAEKLNPGENKVKKEETKTANQETVTFLTTLAQALGKPPRTPILRRPDEYGMEYEDVFFPALDGVTLNGWFIPADSDKLIICNHFSPGNRYGYPGHMEPWNNSGGFEVNFLPKYKALHDAGYNVLAYDMRNHGLSDDASGGIAGGGYMEWRDVIGSIRYAKSRKETANMQISLQSICMGCNATLRTMQKYPEEFEHIQCWIAIQPLNGRTFIERTCEAMGIDVEEGVKTFAPIYQNMTGLRVEDHDMRVYVKSVNLPTLMLQVRNDMLSRASDIQEIYDNLPVEDKKLIWVEDTPWRFHGYTYFSEHPEEMVEWYDAHMK